MLSVLSEIKQRTDRMLALETELMNSGPSKANNIIKQQSDIQEHYYSDVKELLEIMETAVYSLKKLEPLLDHMPKKGYTRNGFNSIIRILEEGF